MTNPTMSPKMVLAPNDVPSCDCSRTMEVDDRSRELARRDDLRCSGMRSRRRCLTSSTRVSRRDADEHVARLVAGCLQELAGGLVVGEGVRWAEGLEAPRERAGGHAPAVHLAHRAEVDGAERVALGALEGHRVGPLDGAGISRDDVPRSARVARSARSDERDLLGAALRCLHGRAAVEEGLAHATPSVVVASWSALTWRPCDQGRATWSTAEGSRCRRSRA